MLLWFNFQVWSKLDIDSDQVDQWVENLRKVGIDEDVLTLT